MGRYTGVSPLRPQHRLDDYGREGNEEYENLYPTREEVLGIANDDSEEDSDD